MKWRTIVENPGRLVSLTSVIFNNEHSWSVHSWAVSAACDSSSIDYVYWIDLVVALRSRCRICCCCCCWCCCGLGFVMPSRTLRRPGPAIGWFLDGSPHSVGRVTDALHCGDSALSLQWRHGAGNKWISSRRSAHHSKSTDSCSDYSLLYIWKVKVQMSFATITSMYVSVVNLYSA